jgi:hypothetical protein
MLLSIVIGQQRVQYRDLCQTLIIYLQIRLLRLGRCLSPRRI